MKLHPGVATAIERFGMNELDVARAMAAGKFPSPQPYENISLFDMRVTGTGAAFRVGLKEFVWRDPGLYLNQDFLDRCNGLPVIIEHPGDAVLDGEEYAKRVVGSVFVPYTKGDEVWAVAKIYDEGAAEYMAAHQLSTSPAVVFRAISANQTVPLRDGTSLLIEDKPALLDHLAVCQQGVWDKGGEPTGVRADSVPTGAKMPEGPRGEMELPLRDGADEKLDRLLAGLDSIGKRIDSVAKRVDALDGGKDPDAMLEDPAEIEKGEPGEPNPPVAASDGEHKEALAPKAELKGAEADIKKGVEELGGREDMARREDPARRDREDRARRDREDRERADRAREDAEGLRKRLDALEGKMAPRPDTEAAMMADAQARADSVAGLFGERAPRPLDGEKPWAYRRRLLSKYKQHSAEFGKIDLMKIGDAGAFEVIENRIYADAEVAARSNTAPEGTLREVITTDRTGRRITEFFGNPETTWAPWKLTPTRLVGINKDRGV